MYTLALLLNFLVCNTGSPEETLAEKYNLRKGNPQIGSLNELTFSPDGILFIGDPVTARVLAVDVEDEARNPVLETFKLEDFESQVAQRLGVSKADVLFHDMALHPRSKNVYLSLSLNKGEWNSAWRSPNGLAFPTMLIKVDLQSKEISEIDLTNLHYSDFRIDSPTLDSVDWKKITIMDLKFRDGKIHVAGLSGDGFKASFRSIEFPFTDQAVTTNLEVFHYIHNHYETFAPINVFDFYNDGDQDKLLAVYYCTPLVTFDMDELNGEGLVRGETISELWPGSSNPLDMLIYEYQNVSYALVSLSSRGLARFKLEDIKAFDGDLRARRQKMTTRYENYHTTKVGVEFKVFPGAVQQLDDYSADHFIALQRMENGNLDLRLRQKKYLSVFGD